MPSYIIPPAGTSAASLFTPSTFVDPANPSSRLARPVDPATGDWTSLIVAQHPIDAMVIRAFRVTENSGPAAVGVGNRFVDVKKIDETTESRIKFEIQRILGRMIRANDLRIDTIDVEAEDASEQVNAFLTYTNLQSMKQTRIQVL